MNIFLIVLTFIFSVTTASARIYRCEVNGKIEFSDKCNSTRLFEEEEKEEIDDYASNESTIKGTGMWNIRYYVDSLGENTREKYISNENIMRGSFNNSATQGSKLNIKFLISNSSDISIQLYEYAGNNPVKASSSESYIVLLQDKNRSRMTLRAVNYSDRLSFDKINSKKIHKALLKGGVLKFFIKEIDTPTTQYNFTIQEADGYRNAYKKAYGKL